MENERTELVYVLMMREYFSSAGQDIQQKSRYQNSQEKSPVDNVEFTNRTVIGAEEQAFLWVNNEREGGQMGGRNKSRRPTHTSGGAIFDPLPTIPVSS